MPDFEFQSCPRCVQFIAVSLVKMQLDRMLFLGSKVSSLLINIMMFPIPVIERVTRHD